MNLAAPLAPVATRSATPAPKADPKAAKAAQDFEAVMLGTLLESLQKSFGGGMDSGALGNAEYATMGTQALATAMAARGGIGIARMVLSQLDKSTGH
jgi:peptidoglycan hydrolase FlgJ